MGYLFISNGQYLKKYKDMCSDYIYDARLSILQSKVIKYLDKHVYPPDEPKGCWIFGGRYNAVCEKYTGDVGGWIVKL